MSIAAVIDGYRWLVRDFDMSPSRPFQIITGEVDNLCFVSLDVKTYTRQGRRDSNFTIDIGVNITNYVKSSLDMFFRRINHEL